MNKGFGISRNNTFKRINETEKIQQRKTLAYVAIYNKNNPELYTEMIQNLKEIENKNKIRITIHNKNN